MSKLEVLSIGAVLAVCASCSAILGLNEPTLDNSIEGGGGDSAGGDGACGNTSSDPHNCGACGHDCLGGMCAASQCQPTVIAQNQGGPFVVREFADRVYWTDFMGGSVSSADKVDASMTLIGSQANGADQPIGLAVDDGGVYFANNGSSGTVLRCSSTSCQAAMTLFDAGFGNSDLALTGGQVYWLQALGDEIDRVAITGGAYQSLATVDTNNSDELLARIATDGQFVYWSETFNDIIRRKLVPAGTNQTIYTLPSGSAPSALLIDSGVLYFATFGSTNGSGTVSSGNLDGSGGAQTLAASQHTPYALASDAVSLYWTAEDDFDMSGNPEGKGSVLSCAKAGCGGNPTVLATGLKDARGIAVDDVAIYFATDETGNGDGKIWRLAK